MLRFRHADRVFSRYGAGEDPDDGDGARSGRDAPMRTAAISVVIGLLLLAPSPVPAQPARKNPPDVVVLSHSWKLEEEWPKIKKTKYSWRARVENRTDVTQKVSIYHLLLDSDDYPLARNAAERVIGPHETVEIVSDSYVENGIIDKIKSSRADLSARPDPSAGRH
jgi:hypothetical protein